MLITNDDQLREFADRASASAVLAVDTEFMREKVYYPKLCLIQLGTRSEQVAVDPFAVRDMSPIARLFENPFITKVFHACSQDMEVILRGVGVLPRPIFDTQIAASYLGDRSQLGYGALVEEYCGVHLPKTESLTDWTRRPLDAAQLEYALDDVRYLPKIYEEMTAELERLGRGEWVRPEFERACDPACYEHVPEEAYRRVKRTGSLSRRQLAVARELAAWRERAAARADRPRRWLLSDETLVEVAKRTPKDMPALERVRGVSDMAYADRVGMLAAVRAGLTRPPEECPEPERHAHPTPEAESVVDLMYGVTRLVAEQQGVAPSTLASREELVAYLCEGSEGSPLAQGWRHEVLGRALDDLLAGRMGLTVKNGRVELL